MHFKKKLQKSVAMALVTAIGLGNVLSVQASMELKNKLSPQRLFDEKNSVTETVTDTEPTAQPTAEPTAQPTAEPTAQPTAEPTAQPTAEPTAQPSAETKEQQTIQLVRGQSMTLPNPEGFSGNIVWSAKFLKADGSFIRNSGSNEIKRELKDGETDGTRKAGDTDASHLLQVTSTTEGATITAQNKGNVVVVAQDETGKTQQWNVNILYEDPAKLPTVTEKDFAQIRENWVKTLIGSNLVNEAGGTQILENLNKEAQTAWDTYAYKGQESCPDIPWKADEGAAGNKDVPYVDDAVEFRPAFKKVLAMAKAYAAEGGALYQNADMLKDITNILDYLCTKCYSPKSQTDNWWTWEIGIPKDLIPALMLIADDLSKEQILRYTDGLYFFQPDPFMEGAINTASTHAQGYRPAQGANIIDCSTTAVGLGALREDNELVYLGMLASSQTFVIQSVKDSTQISETGYDSGFYADGSYLDHGKVPYLGAYGIEFMKGAVKIPNLLANTPWQYPAQVQKNMESYVTKGFANGMYRGMMLDSLKGRSVSRSNSSNQAAGRESMGLILQMVDSFGEPAKSQTLSMLKEWLQYDNGFLDSLSGVENIAVKQKAQQILQDESIVAKTEPMHKSYPLMDRAFHRTEDWLFAVSMYSERIQNTEIMNHENRFGWHQNNGMTYIYDDDNQYTENYWNTVNPLRLPGTTVVPVNIGNGTPDSSGFLQGGDFCSPESWVGGSSLGRYGISGMSFSGAGKKVDGAEPLPYAPELKGKKSWFMFGDEIVCLGAGITNSGMDLPVETTIENRKLNEQADNLFTVNGKQVETPLKQADVKQLVDRSADVSGTTLNNVQWAHLAGTKAKGTGYYFPEQDTTVQVRRAQTTGDWADVGTTEGKSTQNYLEMWFDHGVNPTNESYSYVLLPETTAEQTKQYAQNPAISVLQNTDKVQAVSHKDLKITGINFWQENGGEAAGIESDKAASVMMQETPQGTLQIAVSDPTMKNTGNIRLTVHKKIAGALQTDSNVTFEQIDNETAVLTFAMQGTNGESSFAELKLNQTPQTDKTNLQAAVDQANGLNLSEYTEQSRTALQTALNEANKVLQSETATQQQVEQATNALKAALQAMVKQADFDAAQPVLKMIDELGTITLQSKEKIQKARAAYNALTEEQKKLVTNYDMLVKAEQELAQLEQNATPTPAPTTPPATDTNKPTTSPIVQTGDGTPVGLLGLLTAAAAASAAFFRKRKQN